MVVSTNILHPPKFNSSPLKNDAWKTIVSFWDGIFSGVFAVKLQVGICFSPFIGEDDAKKKDPPSLVFRWDWNDPWG